MISICIPVYNFNVTKLVTDLHEQGLQTLVPFEILLIDDASEEKYRIQNRPLQNLALVQYIELEKNIGRAKIRNELALKARYDYLIYMDCDAEVVSPNYIANYLNYCYKDVICVGGTVYDKTPPPTEYYLRWLIGTKRESANAYKRSKRPNRNFATFNFLMDRDFFLKVCFNEKITGYGHEDTLFSFDLLRHNVTVRHINNPLRHIGWETGPMTLDKCQQGISNILVIVNLLNEDPLFIKNVGILLWEHRIKHIGLEKFMSYIYEKLHKPMERNLLSRSANLSIFSLWKLSYLCFLKEKSHTMLPESSTVKTE